MRIAVAAESDAGEPQAAATRDTIKKMVALGADVAVEPGAGTKSGFSMPTMPPPAPRDARADQTLVAVEPEGELIKTGTKVISHGRSVAFQMAEVAITRQMFQGDFAADC